MIGYRSIGVCTDGTIDPTPGLAEARTLLAPNGTLRLVHVTRRAPLAAAGPPAPGAGAGDPVEAARAWLDGVAGQEDVEPVLLVSDEPCEAVCEWASGAGLGLLVAAPRHSRLERAILGSFTSDLAHRAHCPVLLTRAPAGVAWDDADGVGTVAAVVDQGPAAMLVVHAARAAGPGRLVLVHAVNAGIIERLGGTELAAPAWLVDLAEAEDADDVVVVAGGAGDICDWAGREPAGLLVAAARNAPGPARLGSFTNALAVHAPCPVLVARTAVV